MKNHLCVDILFLRALAHYFRILAFVFTASRFLSIALSLMLILQIQS